MKKNRRYNEEIKSALEEKAKHMEASDDLFERISKDIYERNERETMKNKDKVFKKGKRVAAMVASLILIGSLTVIGVTMGRSWIGHSNLKYKTFPSQERILNDLGFIPKYTESLPGGFEYVNGGTGESKLIDGDGSDLTETTDLALGYKRENEKSLLHLSITQVDEKFLDNKESKFVESLNGVDLYYYQKDYKFVPADYELKEEDKEANEAGKLEISYGASEISVSNVQGLSWYEDGLEYMIMGNDYNFTVEEMIDMARFIIKE